MEKLLIEKTKLEKKNYNRLKTSIKGSIGKKNTGGRNNRGRITAFHRGGGNKRRLRYIENLTYSNKENTNLMTGIVKSIERDPNRSTLIALVYWFDSKNKKNSLWSEYSYILAPEGLKVGQYLNSNSSLLKKKNDLDKVSEKKKETTVQIIPVIGNLYLLKELAVGTTIHNIDGKYIRSAGCSGIIISKIEKLNPLTKELEVTKVLVSLQSGESKNFNGDCKVSVGKLSNAERNAYKYYKAGQKRWLGRRPIVRGVAMNPIDHPHGGGEGKSSGGRPSVTPWGKPTKGKPTRPKSKPSLYKSLNT